MSALAEPINEQVYRKLLGASLAHVIHTEEENEHYIAELEALHDRGHLEPEEQELSELLTLLIEDFERKHYALKPASPIDIVRELMAANNLKQSDLVDVFGTPSIASEVLRGKRELAKSHIERLSRRFHISPEVFFPVWLAGVRKRPQSGSGSENKRRQTLSR
jgi:HTH-type transcriptional regulator/antitoxin HigA